MNIQSLRTLLSISETGSFSETAGLLNMTLPAVSMQMKALEESLGAKLFDRTARPPRMTPEARALLPDIRVILAARARIEAMSQEDDGLRGRYRIGFVPTTSVRLLPGFLKQAQSQAPEARFEASTGLSATLCSAVQAGTLDCAVVTDDDLPDRLHCTTISTEDMALALPDGFEGATLSDLPDALPFLQFLPAGGIGRHIDTWLRENRHQPKDRITFDMVEPIIECLSHGIGYTILPRPDLERWPEKPFHIHPLPGTPLTRDLVFVARDGMLGDTARAQILAMLQNR